MLVKDAKPVGVRKWTLSQLKEAVKSARTMRQVAHKLGFSGHTPQTITIQKYIYKHNLDISHWKPQSQRWLKTYSVPKPSESRLLLEQILTNPSPYRNNPYLRRMLLNKGLKHNICEICGVKSWMGQELVCTLHHMNGNTVDNRIENLQTLCPNCHSQTHNFGGKKNKGLLIRQSFNDTE